MFYKLLIPPLFSTSRIQSFFPAVSVRCGLDQKAKSFHGFPQVVKVFAHHLDIRTYEEGGLKRKIGNHSQDDRFCIFVLQYLMPILDTYGGFIYGV
jgi:hypothetical protein